MTAWHVGRMVGFDLESTGVDPLEARIVTAALVHTAPGQRPSTIQWLLDPGVDIPAEAAAVHGWTRDRILAEVGGPGRAVRVTSDNRMPMQVDGALGEIAGQLAVAMKAEAPVVIANAAYDCTLLESELPRHGIDTLSSRPTGVTGVVDPMVLEKAYDPYRRVKGGCRGGKHRCGGCGVTDKTLTSLCTHYGVRLTAAHSAGADALAAIRVAARLASLWPEIARWRLPTLHAHQVTWRAEQANSLRGYFDKNGIDHDGVDPSWPLHSSLTRQAVPA